MHQPPLAMRVARTVDEALDIRSFELVDEAGAPLPPFTAGAHACLQPHPGPGPVAMDGLPLAER